VASNSSFHFIEKLKLPPPVAAASFPSTSWIKLQMVCWGEADDGAVDELDAALLYEASDDAAGGVDELAVSDDVAGTAVEVEAALESSGDVPTLFEDAPALSEVSELAAGAAGAAGGTAVADCSGPTPSCA